jgi:pimeloyl-ACP methyl ester carboxylesterase
VPLSALILFGFIKDPDLEYAKLLDPQTPARGKTTRADAVSDFISPHVTPRAVIEAFTAQALTTDPVRMDWIREHEFNAITPTRVMVPTMVVYGERDPGIAGDAVARYFSRLTVAGRQWTVLAGGDHAAQLEDSHDAFIDAVAGFLLRPAVRTPGGRAP